MKQNLLFELIKLIENGVEYSMDEVQILLEEGTLFEKLIEKVEGTDIVFRSIDNDMANKIKESYSFYKEENGHKYPLYTNGLSLICCIIIEKC